MQKTTQVQEKTQLERIKELYRSSLLQHYVVLHNFSSPEDYYLNIKGIESLEDFVNVYGIQAAIDLDHFYNRDRKELCIEYIEFGSVNVLSLSSDSTQYEDSERPKKAMVIKVVPEDGLVLIFSLFE